jgi:hypothetical protein
VPHNGVIISGRHAKHQAPRQTVVEILGEQNRELLLKATYSRERNRQTATNTVLRGTDLSRSVTLANDLLAIQGALGRRASQKDLNLFSV